jgi:hypothetical protein
MKINLPDRTRTASYTDEEVEAILPSNHEALALLPDADYNKNAEINYNNKREPQSDAFWEEFKHTITLTDDQETEFIGKQAEAKDALRYN